MHSSTRTPVVGHTCVPEGNPFLCDRCIELYAARQRHAPDCDGTCPTCLVEHQASICSGCSTCDPDTEN